MPRTLYDEEGNPFEVPDDNEIAELKVKAESADELAQKAAELEAAANPNFKAMRDREKRYKEALKASGKEVDEEGNIVDNTVLTKEEVQRLTAETVTATQFEIEKQRVFSRYTDKEKELADYYFSKLINGEEKTLENLYKFSKEAERMAFPEQTNRVADRLGAPLGGSPIFNQKGGVNESTVSMGEQFGFTEDDLKNGGEIKY